MAGGRPSRTSGQWPRRLVLTPRLAPPGGSARGILVSTGGVGRQPRVWHSAEHRLADDGERRCSHAHELRQMIEVLVASVQRQVVLQNKRCEPHVVRRNRRALLPELMKHRGVMVGRLIVGTQDVHTILQEKLPESATLTARDPRRLDPVPRAPCRLPYRHRMHSMQAAGIVRPG
jgi:hypothetical protein